MHGIIKTVSVPQIGDTVADIGEGLNAGMWTVGYTTQGNEVGLSEVELAALTPEARKAAIDRAAKRLRAAGAHYIIEGAAQLEQVIDHIEARLAIGQRP